MEFYKAKKDQSGEYVRDMERDKVEKYAYIEDDIAREISSAKKTGGIDKTGVEKVLIHFLFDEENIFEKYFKRYKV